MHLVKRLWTRALATVPSAHRPNYFLAVRVDDEQIISKIRQVQEQVQQHQPEFKKAVIDPNTLHVTLGLLNLQSKHELQTAKTHLLLSQRKPKDADAEEADAEAATGKQQLLQIKFVGLSTFHGKVFACLVLACG